MIQQKNPASTRFFSGNPLCSKILPLLRGCPVGKGGEQCPLCGVRKLPFYKRVLWLKQQDQTFLTDLLCFHNSCVTEGTPASLQRKVDCSNCPRRAGATAASQTKVCLGTDKNTRSTQNDELENIFNKIEQNHERKRKGSLTATKDSPQKPSILSLPQKTDILLKLEDEFKRAAPDILDIESILSRDPELPKQVVLKSNANDSSPEHERIDNLHEAYLRLGLPRFRQIALSASARLLVGTHNPHFEEVWKHHEEVAFLTQSASELTKRASPHDAFLLGLFHDFGTFLLLDKHWDYQQLLFRALHFNPGVIESESRLVHTNHACVGGMITRSWGLPKAICDAIKHHHSDKLDDSLPDEVLTYIALLTLAGNALLHLRLGYNLLFDMKSLAMLKSDIGALLGIDSLDMLELHDSLLKNAKKELPYGH